jgi:hypothetical protein
MNNWIKMVIVKYESLQSFKTNNSVNFLEKHDVVN